MGRFYKFATYSLITFTIFFGGFSFAHAGVFDVFNFFNKVGNFKKIGIDFNKLFARGELVEFFNKDGASITSIPCGETFSVQSEGNDGNEIWIIQSKNGSVRYDGLLPVPLTYTTNCGDDVGIYYQTFYSYFNGQKNEQTSQNIIFEILPSAGGSQSQLPSPDGDSQEEEPDVDSSLIKINEICRVSIIKNSVPINDIRRFQISVGNIVDWIIEGDPGLSIYWFGTGISDPDGVFVGVTPYKLTYQYKDYDVGKYVRHAEAKDSNGNIICRSGNMLVRVVAGASETPLVSILPTPTPTPESLLIPKFRPESGFGFSKDIYSWMAIDYSDINAIKNQMSLLKQAGVSGVQVYLMRWSEVGLNLDRTVSPFAAHDQINNRIMNVASDAGMEIYSEFFSHEPGLFESVTKNSNSNYPINVPKNQVSPLKEVVKNGLISQFYNYVYETVNKYPQIKYWGFINEADTYELEDLIILQNTFYDAVKSANSTALVGSASPTFPELLAPREKLHPTVISAMNSGRTNWLRTHPEIYNFWKSFYSRSKYDFVQVHQLGMRYWTASGEWKDDGFKISSSGQAVFDPVSSSRWQLLKSGIDNVRTLTGNKQITSQVDIGTDLSIGHPDYWPRVGINFEEAASGKYGYNMLDIYQLKENMIIQPSGREEHYIETFVFDKEGVPTDLYKSIQKTNQK